MPSLSLKSLQPSSASQFNASSCAADARSAAVWSRSNTEDVSFSQLHEFWSGLSIAARRELLRIDKQTLFEQVRKNLYCSRCHGLLVEGFNQILTYGKSLQAGIVGQKNGGGSAGKNVTENSHPDEGVASLPDDSRDPSVHPWGGLSATRDSMLTVLDCFLNETPLEVFDNARVRERERELLYPDACGRGGRGWICQNGSFNGRGHGLKETCVLYTVRLSCEALVDFWSALGDETRLSLLRMKEEDFIERLLFRFNSKRFCRDCRRNVLREFKEMKELKRSRKELQCTRWFCAADAVFHYEVSESAVQVDWHNCLAGDGGSAFQRFEWALGTGEGKSDILPFEDVGLSESAYVDNIDLANTSACFITLRGWRRDGRCTELSAKAHALKRQLCVHRRLIVGDGYVSITKGDSIQRFFERAEEIEEEEDEDTIDKDGNDHEGEASRPQKHAKSPELARDFLLDAATVIFKEQVEKAFREGTARQNAHSVFVCLALSLLEERVRVACKEITSLEKQKQLLEEEEYEKREEVEKRERRKQKEKEKKLRRKEKLKNKEKANVKNCTSAALDSNGAFSTSSLDNFEEERESNSGSQVEGTESNSSEDSMSARPSSPDMIEARPSADGFDSENGGFIQHEIFASAQVIDDAVGWRDGNGAFIVERSKSDRRKTQGRRMLLDTSIRGLRKGFTPLLEADGNSRNILDPHCCEEKGTLSPQEQPKDRVHNIEVEALTRSVDGWSRSPTRNRYSRHEGILSCACSSSHAGSRSTVGHRVLGRTGIRQSNASTRPAERAGFGDRSSKSLLLFCNGDPALTRKSSEQTQSRSLTATILERKEQSLGSIADRGTKTSHLKSHSLNLGSGISSGHHGRSKNLNDSSGHGPLENFTSVPVVVKPMWMPRAGSASNGVAVHISPVGSRPSVNEHGKNDSSCNVSQVRSVSSCTPAPTSVPSKATKMTTEEFTESAKEEPTFAESSSSVAEGKVFGVLDPNAPIPPRTTMITDSGEGNFLVTGTDSKVEISPPKTSAHEALSKTVPVQMVPSAVNTESNPSSEDTLSTDSGPVRTREGQDSSLARRPGASQGTLNFVPEVNLSTKVQQSFPPSDNVLGMSPQVYTNGHRQVHFLQDNLLRPPSNSMYTHVADILATQGSFQHPTQPSNMTPLHYPWPFGYFPVGPWSALGRTGVLPTQADGYAVSGPGGLRMGVLPPMSLAAPGNVISGELESGLLSEIPNGLNDLQIRDQKPSMTHQVFLSQFGGSPGRGPHGRVVVENIPCSRSDSCWLEGAVATNVDHLHECQDLPNGSQLPLPGVNENRLTNSPTSGDFSFFHSEWPMSRNANENNASKSNTLNSNSNSSSNLPMSVAEKIQLLGGTDGVSKSSLPVGEYSLFASAPSKGFGFF